MYYILIFIVAAIVGYFIINNVPALLHTPLMSGMNALSGITIIGALSVTAAALKDKNAVLGLVVGFIAIVLAMINACGGFGITARMLKMFKREERGM